MININGLSKLLTCRPLFFFFFPLKKHAVCYKNPTENKITTTLDIMANPVSFGMVPAASVAYHNISEAQNGYYVNYTEDDAYDISKQKSELDKVRIKLF